MSENYDQPSVESQERTLSEEGQDQTVGKTEGERDHDLELRLQNQADEYARERAELAEQLSQLLEENDFLKQRIQELEQYEVLQQAEPSILPQDINHPERALGLDFSLADKRQ